jgi:hypothetical protein
MRAVLSGSANNFSVNSATVIAPSPMVTPEHALHFREHGSGQGPQSTVDAAAPAHGMARPKLSLTTFTRMAMMPTSNLRTIRLIIESFISGTND